MIVASIGIFVGCVFSSGQANMIEYMDSRDSSQDSRNFWKPLSVCEKNLFWILQMKLMKI